MGGLGNQMFQYAFGRKIAYENNTELFFDISSYSYDHKRKYELNCFPVKGKIISPTRLFFLKPFLSRVSEKKYEFNSDYCKLKNNTYASGYWQSEKYFSDISETIRKDFTFPSELFSENHRYFSLIKSSHSVSIHVRRGDYVTNPGTNIYHGTCPVSYYKRAVYMLGKQIKNIKLFVFSDDIEWSKDNLRFQYPTFFVDNSSEKSYTDMKLMSLCKYHVIANSSFSWWAAWLNPRRDKIVISPKRWFTDSAIQTSDFIPEEWIRI